MRAALTATKRRNTLAPTVRMLVTMPVVYSSDSKE